MTVVFFLTGDESTIRSIAYTDYHGNVNESDIKYNYFSESLVDLYKNCRIRTLNQPITRLDFMLRQKYKTYESVLRLEINHLVARDSRKDCRFIHMRLLDCCSTNQNLDFKNASVIQYDIGLLEYYSDSRLRLFDLLLGSFLAPIYSLFKACFPISAMKLLYSMVDTLGYLEYGLDEGSVLENWLREYWDKPKVMKDVRISDLVSHRNALIHATSTESHKHRTPTSTSSRPMRIALTITSDSKVSNAKLDDFVVNVDIGLFFKSICCAIRHWEHSYRGNDKKISIALSRLGELYFEESPVEDAGGEASNSANRRIEAIKKEVLAFICG